MIKNVDKMQRCGLLIYAGQAETREVITKLNKTEDTLVRTAAGEAQSTECPLHTTLPQSTRQPIRRIEGLPPSPHKVAVEQVDSLGQQQSFPSAVVGTVGRNLALDLVFSFLLILGVI